MKSYSEKNIFTPRAIKYFKFATEKIKELGDSRGEIIRCHELARAIHRLIDDSDVKVVDGLYAAVDHTWLMVDCFILDVYKVGSLPMVQLSAIVPGEQLQYREDSFRFDIDDEEISLLVSMMGSN